MNTKQTKDQQKKVVKNNEKLLASFISVEHIFAIKCIL